MGLAARNSSTPERIPTLPAVVGKLLSLYADEDNYRSSDVVDLLEHDPAISARLLRLANSPFYSFTGDISSVGSAAMLLGSSTVQGVALGSSLLAPWGNSLAPEAVRTVWIHSWLAAVGAKTLAKAHGTVGVPDTEILFTAALLHDIGKILLLNRDPQNYAPLLETIGGPELSQAEATLFGQTHESAGFEALFRWNLAGPVPALAAARGVADVRPEHQAYYKIFKAAHDAATGLNEPPEAGCFPPEALMEMAEAMEASRDLADEFYRALVQKWT